MYITISDSDANFEIVLHITVVVKAVDTIAFYLGIQQFHILCLDTEQKLDNNTFSHK